MKRNSFKLTKLLVLLKAPQQIFELQAYCQKEGIDTEKVILLVDRSKDYPQIVWREALAGLNFARVIMSPTKSGNHWIVHFSKSLYVLLNALYFSLDRVLVLDPTIPLFILLGFSSKIRFTLFFDGVDILRKQVSNEVNILPRLNKGYFTRSLRVSILERLSIASTYPVPYINSHEVSPYHLSQVCSSENIILFIGSYRELSFHKITIENRVFRKYFKAHPRFPKSQNIEVSGVDVIPSYFILEKYLRDNGLRPLIIIGDYSHSLWNMVNMFSVDEIILPLPQTDIERRLILFLKTKTVVRISEELH